MPHQPTTTPAQRLAEIIRELGQKQKHYPGWYRDGKLTEATGKHRIACFVDVIEDLKRLYEVPTQTSLFDDTAARTAAPAPSTRPVSADNRRKAQAKPRTQWD